MTVKQALWAGRNVRVAVVGAALLALSACSQSNGDTPTPVQTGSTAAGGAAQRGLETVPLTITEGSTAHRFTVELAVTEQQQEVGLMHRTSVPPDTGMLFPYQNPQPLAYWMKNTLVPLDMIFIRQDGTIDRIAENTVPESLEPVASGGAVIAVLELAGGTAARLNITEKAIVRWQGDAIQR